MVILLQILQLEIAFWFNAFHPVREQKIVWEICLDSLLVLTMLIWHQLLIVGIKVESKIGKIEKTKCLHLWYCFCSFDWSSGPRFIFYKRKTIWAGPFCCLRFTINELFIHERNCWIFARSKIFESIDMKPVIRIASQISILRNEH